MSLTLAEWAKAVPDPRGQMLALATADALGQAAPIFKLLQFLSIRGQSWNPVWGTSSTQKATRAINTDFTEATPKPETRVFPMRAAGGEQKLDRNLIGGDPTGNMKFALLTQKVEDIGRRLYRQFFTGDAANADEFDGLNTICTDLTRYRNHTTAAGGAINKKLLNEALAKVPGANLILCNTTIADEVDDLDAGKVTRSIVVNQGSNPTPDMFARTYKGVPVLAVGTAPNDTTGAEEEILDFDETQSTSADCTRITVVRLGLSGLHGVQQGQMDVTERGVVGAWDIVDLNWMLTPATIAKPDCIWQIRGIRASA